VGSPLRSNKALVATVVPIFTHATCFGVIGSSAPKPRRWRMQKNKISIEAPSTQLKADMQRVGSSMLLEWLSKAGADGKEIIDAFNKK